jgi:hypothetical protein
MYMKKILLYSLIASVLFSSCTKELEVNYPAKTFIEFDANVFNAPTTPYSYTVVTRNVPFGYASATSYPLISRTSGMIKLRVNVVGEPLGGKEQVITYKVITNATPVSPNALAVSGTHFTTTGSLTIPANSLYGELTINILNPGVSSTTPREIHLELEPNSDVGVTGTSNKVAVRISQS